MAKVIKRGAAHLRTPVQTTCYRCSSVIWFEESDIESDQRDGDYVVCPVCGSFISKDVVWSGK